MACVCWNAKEGGDGGLQLTSAAKYQVGWNYETQFTKRTSLQGHYKVFICIPTSLIRVRWNEVYVSAHGWQLWPEKRAVLVTHGCLELNLWVGRMAYELGGGSKRNSPPTWDLFTNIYGGPTACCVQQLWPLTSEFRSWGGGAAEQEVSYWSSHECFLFCCENTFIISTFCLKIGLSFTVSSPSVPQLPTLVLE